MALAVCSAMRLQFRLRPIPLWSAGPAVFSTVSSVARLSRLPKTAAGPALVWSPAMKTNGCSADRSAVRPCAESFVLLVKSSCYKTKRRLLFARFGKDLCQHFLWMSRNFLGLHRRCPPVMTQLLDQIPARPICLSHARFAYRNRTSLPVVFGKQSQPSGPFGDCDFWRGAQGRRWSHPHSPALRFQTRSSG